jgi:predicted nucleic acid-binding protein
MSRVFFDAMLFAYVMEGHQDYAPVVKMALERCYERNDVLLTSCLAVAEVMAGKGVAEERQLAARQIRELGFELVNFDETCMEQFARLRAEARLKGPDAIHLACAAAARTDLFLTNDKQLLQRRLTVSGIQFIAHFETDVLGFR